VTWSGVLSTFGAQTTGVNASGALDSQSGADNGSRVDWSNILISVQRTAGTFRFGATLGSYAFPVAGQAINPTFQRNANTSLYGYVPSAYVQVVPDEHFTFSLGRLPTLLGQENAFTFQNYNIQRGLAWNAEPVVSRGVRGQFTNGKLNAALEFNDGYYSGSHRAVEGSLAWSATPSSALSFAFILPDADTPANPTAFIANKSEYDLMFTGQYGKLSLTPYLLWVRSPKSAAAAFVNDESAFFASALADFSFTDAFSIGARFESAQNGSSPLDSSSNADFIGYGPGSNATTYTLTPQYKTKHFFARAEWSRVQADHVTRGFGFGSQGTGTSQTRVAAELGTQF